MTMSVYELSKQLQEKKISSQELVSQYIKQVHQVEEQVKAFLSFDEEGILKAAKEVDDKRSNGETLSSLAGIPVSIKDNICTQGERTTCASKMLENFIPPYDAGVITKIRQEDMILFGKLNMDEFAMGSSTENSAFQKTRNPWNLEHVPGGSSGGSAAAVAAGMTPLALGSDTGGSIRQPAAYCGVVGLKPTYGRVSRYGLVAFASSLDQIGPVANSSMDAALLLNVISGHDRMDSTSAPYPKEDFTLGLEQELKGKRIGLPLEFFGEGIHPEVKAAVLKAAKEYERLGAIVEEVRFDLTDLSLPAYYLISSAEASSNLARFDGVKYGYRTKDFDNLLDLYKKSRDEGFGSEVKRRIMLGTYALSSGYYDAYYKKAQQVRTVMKQEFDQLFCQYDALLTPTGPTTAFRLGEKTANPVEMYLTDICTVPVNIAGVPAISINCGFDSQGLPIGMQLIGKAFDEKKLLNLTHQFERYANYEKKAIVL
ncbi:MAG: Asp-tRNA(Asn)/Glu-tRNA(Gln) amidotransferase subunit GatA [Vallitaleaceae bacterium]|nr:Asp-tRNA(Asn)/Glu-tRNA(Gln) amidotransferase subunit GatA [Vallitaleaceae bacterium]